MPSCSAFSMASRMTSSMSISFSDSSCVSMRRASLTLTRRFFLFLGISPPIISLRFMSMPMASMASLPVFCCSTSISTSSFSSSPFESCCAICCRLLRCSVFSSSLSSLSASASGALPEPSRSCIGLNGFCTFLPAVGISSSISLCSAAAFATVSTAS